MKHPKDMAGYEIMYGDIVVYPGRRGSSLWLNRGTVREVTKNSIIVERENGGRKVTITNLHRVAIAL